MKYKILVMLFLAMWSGFSQGKIDGFYRGKGNATVVLGFGFEEPKKYFAGTTKLDLSRSTSYINLFTSYGITNDLDAQVALPYISTDQASKFQDISLFLKYRFFKKKSRKL